MSVKGFRDATVLQRILLQHIHERVAVLGVPCSGKSTLSRLIPHTLDMDNVLFPQLTAEEKAFVFQKPWFPEVGVEMKRLAREKITVCPGAPVFVTVLLDVDFVIYLWISDELLRQRIATRENRPQPFELCKGIQQQLERDILESRIPWIQFKLTKENHGQ